MAIDGQRLMAAGGILGALAASSCCIVPLALFGLGVSGAWIGNLTRLAPYQPCFIVATLGFLAAGYWLVFRDSKTVGADGESCAHPWPNRLVSLLWRRCLCSRRLALISSLRFCSTHKGNTL